MFFAVQPAGAQDALTLQEALGAPSWLHVSGASRVRYETRDGPVRVGDVGGDHFIALRNHLKVGLELGRLEVVGEIMDSRVYLDDAQSRLGVGEVNAFEPIQAYGRLKFRDVFTEGATASVQAGRFTMNLGSRRLVARSNFGNTTNTFTGMRLDWEAPSGVAATAFYSLPARRLPSDRASLAENRAVIDAQDFDLQFWGVFVKAPVEALGADLELFTFGLQEFDDAGGGRQTRDRRIVTPGFRLTREPAAGRWDYEIEAAVQAGAVSASALPGAERLDVFARHLHAGAGYLFDAPWRPRLSVEFDYASGDDDPDDARFGRFDSLLGSGRGDFGPSGAYGALARANLISPGLRIGAKPDARTDGYVFYRALFLDAAADSFGATGVRDAAGASGRFAGQQVEMRVRRWLVAKRLQLEAGGAVLFAGPSLEDAPNATGEGDAAYAYVSLEATY